jgi:hypothetical protein
MKTDNNQIENEQMEIFMTEMALQALKVGMSWDMSR